MVIAGGPRERGYGAVDSALMEGVPPLLLPGKVNPTDSLRAE